MSVCHCFSCQQRTGSAFGYQARFPRSAVTIAGDTTAYAREADSGNEVTFHFCPRCGSTLYWIIPGMEDFLMVAAGAFTDPTFHPPKVEVYESRRHPWVAPISHAS